MISRYRWSFFEESCLSSRSPMLVRLLLVSPASSAEAEGSFSALRRLKAWLRSTMTQVQVLTRLQSATFTIGSSQCNWCIDMLINEFVSSKEKVRSCLGNDCVLSYHVGQSCVNISIICPFPITYYVVCSFFCFVTWSFGSKPTGLEPTDHRQHALIR